MKKRNSINLCDTKAKIDPKKKKLLEDYLKAFAEKLEKEKRK